VDNYVEKWLYKPRKWGFPAVSASPVHFSLGNFFMQINHLHVHDWDMTGELGQTALSGAAVEFLSRVNRGFRGD